MPSNLVVETSSMVAGEQRNFKNIKYIKININNVKYKKYIYKHKVDGIA